MPTQRKYVIGKFIRLGRLRDALPIHAENVRLANRVTRTREVDLLPRGCSIRVLVVGRLWRGPSFHSETCWPEGEPPIAGAP